MFAQLGDIQFDLITSFNTMSTSQKVDYAEHAVIDGKPRLQWVGDALEEISLRLSFNAGFCDPTAELKSLRDAASQHCAMALVLGNGEYRGNYVISEIGDDIQQTFAEGTLIAVDVDVKLKEWAESVAQTQGGKLAKAKANAKKSSGGRINTARSKESVPLSEIVRQW